jgi:hypothetical protein
VSVPSNDQSTILFLALFYSVLIIRRGSEHSFGHNDVWSHKLSTRNADVALPPLAGGTKRENHAHLS